MADPVSKSRKQIALMTRITSSKCRLSLRERPSFCGAKGDNPIACTTGSAGRPFHLTAAEQVHVQMRHRLTGSLSAVDDQTITILQSELLRQLKRHEVHVAKQLAVLVGQ